MPLKTQEELSRLKIRADIQRIRAKQEELKTMLSAKKSQLAAITPKRKKKPTI